MSSWIRMEALCRCASVSVKEGGISVFIFQISIFDFLLLFQAILLSFFQERLAADAQNLGRPADLVMRGFKRRGDDFPLGVLERAQPGHRTRSAGSGCADRLRKVFRLQNIGLRRWSAAVNAREHDGAFKRVAKLTHISWPRVGRKHASRRIA